MASAPIYNPVIPCLHPIPGGMFPGRMIRIQGSVPPGAQRFAINLQCGPNTDPRDDIALHLNFRFVEMCVVRNHLSTMSWGVEETNGGMPLVRGEAFEALVLCEPQLMKVALNGAHFCEFPHRIPFQRISHITVDGDVMIQFIGFEGAEPAPAQMYMQSQPPAYGAYGAPPAYGAPGYGAPQGFVGGPQPQFVQATPGMQGAPRMHGYPAGAQGMPMQGMPMQGMPMQGMPMQGMPMQGGRGGGGARGMRGMPGGRRDKRGGMGLGTGLAMGAAGLAAGGVAGYGAAGGFGNLTGSRASPGGGNEGGNEGGEAENSGNQEGSGNEEGYSGNEEGYDEGDDDANDDTGDDYDYNDGGADGGDYGGDDD